MLSYYGAIISTIPLHTYSTSSTPLIPRTRYPSIQANLTKKSPPKHSHINWLRHPIFATTLSVLASVIISANLGNAETMQQQQLQRKQDQEQGETLANIPEELSGVCDEGKKDCNKRGRIQRPKSKQAESCTVKCVNTCIRGGYGAPGEGPLNIRRFPLHTPIIVFKQGFHSRQYCLVECSDICNLIKDGDDGP